MLCDDAPSATLVLTVPATHHSAEMLQIPPHINYNDCLLMHRTTQSCRSDTLLTASRDSVLNSQVNKII